MGLLDDKVVLVNGGSQGVGAGIVRAALREGATVAFTGRRTGLGEKFAAETGATFVRADLTDPAQARGSVEQVVAAHGRIDCLVNAAGLTSRGTLLDTTPELFDAHVAINLRAPFFAMQAAVQHLVDRGAPGTVVNIITSSAHGGQSFLAHETSHHRERLRIGDALGAVDHVAVEILGRLAATDAFDGVGTVRSDATGLDPVSEPRADWIGENHADVR